MAQRCEVELSLPVERRDLLFEGTTPWVALGNGLASVGDVDGDGRPDLLISAIDSHAILGMNRTGPDHARLCVRLLGPMELEGSAPRTPRDGTGARCVMIVGSGAEGHALLAEAFTAAGYQSASSPWLHFGLGDEATFKTLRISWPSGAVEELPGGPAGRRLWIREGEGVVREESL